MNPTTDSLVFPELPTYLFAPTLGGLLSLIVQIVLPLLAALLMKASWSTSAKGVVLLAASALKSFVEAWLAAIDANTAFDLRGAAINTLVVWGIAVGIHFGFLRGTSVQRAAISSGVSDGR